MNDIEAQSNFGKKFIFNFEFCINTIKYVGV